MKARYSTCRWTRRNVIGRFAMVRADNIICLANIVDRVPGRNLAKRVRLQTGEHAGEVRNRAEYELLEFVNTH